MSINPLNDISKVYLEQVAYVDESAIGNRARSAVADDRLSAEQERTNASMDKLRAQDSRHKKSTSLARAQARIAAKKSEDTARAMHPKPGVSGYRIEETGIDEAKKEKPKRWWDDDGDGIGYEKGEVSGKFKRKKVKEGFSNWREDLFEVMDDTEVNQKITEKKVKNKIKTSAMGGGIKIGEALEEIGATLIEMVEIDEVDYIIESVYDELIEEGYEEDEVEYAIEYALTEAKVTFGHDTATTEKKKKSLLDTAREKLSGVKASAKAAVARGARKVAKGALGVARKMEGGDNKVNPRSKGVKPTSAPKRPPSAAGTKEKVSSGSYQAPTTTKKKAQKPSDPWEGSYIKSSDAPKPKPKVKTKTTKVSGGTSNAPKRKKKSKLDSLLADIRSEEVQIDEKINLAKARMGDVIGDFYTSDAPQFKGKSKEKRRQMAIAAKLTAERGGKKLGEQMDDEMSTSTSSVDDQKMQQQRKKIQMQKIKDLTTRLAAARKGVY